MNSNAKGGASLHFDYRGNNVIEISFLEKGFNR